MLPVHPFVVFACAVVAMGVVQVAKSAIPKTSDLRRFIPLAAIVVVTPIGAGFALYTGNEWVGGALEGFIAALVATGLYEGGKAIAPKLFSRSGWLAKKKT